LKKSRRWEKSQEITRNQLGEITRNHKKSPEITRNQLEEISLKKSQRWKKS
jgi:hypothetical protein